MNALRDRVTHARWVKRESMHVTLRFLGDTDASKIPSLRELVGELARLEARVPIDARTLVAFPDPRRARVLGVELEGEELARLAAAAEAALVARGFPAETRVYRAHITMARLRTPMDLRAVLGHPISMRGHATSITLYESELLAGGARHTVLASATLDAPQRSER